MFTGYSDKTVDFFWDIRFNNSREWFHPRKDQFNAYIMDPTKALSGELYDWLTEKLSPAAPESAHLERSTAMPEVCSAEVPSRTISGFHSRTSWREGKTRPASGLSWAVRAMATASATGASPRLRQGSAGLPIRTRRSWRSSRKSWTSRTCFLCRDRSMQDQKGTRTTA